MADARSCNCSNKTRDNRVVRPDNTRQQSTDLRHVIIAVAATVGFIAMLTIAVSIWLTIRRRKLNEKCDRTSDSSDEHPNSKRPSHETTRVRIDMYGGSLSIMTHPRRCVSNNALYERVFDFKSKRHEEKSKPTASRKC
ncbi:hypothetical protein QZH41_002318 [Actinostola sp. cb2023]|nr:hypothetical protein QZH41_002318 [Actinostola sp. cb2023]